MRLIYITAPLMMVGAMWASAAWIRGMDIATLGLMAMYYRSKVPKK
jgi:hypothetical protein